MEILKMHCYTYKLYYDISVFFMGIYPRDDISWSWMNLEHMGGTRKISSLERQLRSRKANIVCTYL